MNGEIRVKFVAYSNRPYYLLQYRDPFDGKKKTVCSKIPRTGKKREKDLAAKAAGRLEAELREGRYLPASHVTWAVFKERYTLEICDQRAANTAGKVATVFKLIDQHFKLKRVSDLNEARIAEWINRLGDETDAAGRLVRTPATIASHLRHLRAILNWARRRKYIREVPSFDMPRMVKEMKGRPITAEEHERMLAKVEVALTPEVEEDAPPPVAPDAADVAAWKRFLTGLWASGLRLGEAMVLSWEPGAPVSVVMQHGKKPALHFRPHGQKARRQELTPVAPEFGAMLEAVPEAERTGLVFRLPIKTVWTASKVITTIGAKAGVVVDSETGKTASAHDYRRAFATRWARRVMPATLKRMMRHRDIATTMAYYVDQDVEEISADLWRAYAANSEAAIERT